MRKIKLFCILSFIVLVMQTGSKGAPVSYTLEITSGGAQTSGGFSGNGVGYLSLYGTFKLTIDYNAGYADLEDINISFSKPYYPVAFDWSSLEGTFNLGTLSLSSPCGIHLSIDNSLSGNFDGNAAFLHGTVYDNAYDCYQYDCTINAKVISESVVPVPEYTSGEIWAWGNNDHGECNVPSPNTDFNAIAAGCGHSLGLKQDGSIVAWGYNELGECDVPSPNTGFKAIATSAYYSLGLKTDGSIVAWGDNRGGQLDVPVPNSDFIAIAAGSGHSLGLKADGSIVAWGWNSSGQCDVPSPNTDFKAIAAGSYHSLGLKKDGSIVAWGLNEDFVGTYMGQCDVPAPNTGFKAISAGFWHSLGLKQDGSIVAWGYNEYGQCNVPSPNTDFKAISAGWWNSLGLKQDDSIAGWGYDYFGQSTLPSQTPNTGFTVISAGADHTLALKKMNVVTVNSIDITRCTVIAGKTQGLDVFWASGKIEFPSDLHVYSVNHIDVNIISLTDGASIYTETVDSGVVRGSFKYTHNIPRGGAGAITSLTVDFNKKTFSIKARNVDLTGLSCPLRLVLTLDSSVILSGDADESVVNGRGFIPVRLMTGSQDFLQVQSLKVKKGKLTDTLTVKGGIAYQTMPTSISDVVLKFDNQTFTIPSASLKPSGKSGLKYVCKNASLSGGQIAAAAFDFGRCSFVISIKNTKINSTSGAVGLTLTIGSFSEQADFDLGG